jgi:hypothetical protein
MRQDMRRVQTAVLGHYDSFDPVVMPLDRDEAKQFRAFHDREGDTFWCGIHLGGCGKELMDRIGEVKIPHFAHYADRHAESCRRTRLGLNSADHLYINKFLTRWLSRLGRTVIGRPVFENTFSTGGGCTAITIRPSGRAPLLAVQLDDGEVGWEERDYRLRSSGTHVQWLFGVNTRAAQMAIKRDGYALRIRCTSRGIDRVVTVAIQLSGQALEWSDITSWALVESGISIPQIDHIRKDRTVSPHAAIPEAPAAASGYTAFPLAIEELIVMPKAVESRPWVGPGDMYRNHSLPVAVQMVDGAWMADATLVLPGPYAGLTLAASYQLLGPAFIRANVDPQRLSPRWLIDAEGLTLTPSIRGQATMLGPCLQYEQVSNPEPRSNRQPEPAGQPARAQPDQQTIESAPQEKRAIPVKQRQQNPPTLERREEMRIREAMANLITQLERTRRVKNFSRGRELWNELSSLPSKVPGDRFGYEQRMANEYKAWVERKNRSNTRSRSR